MKLAIPPIVLCLFGALSTAQDLDHKASPFDEIRWSADADGADQPTVRVDETWYRPIAIDGVPVPEILTTCDEHWPGKRRKRFAEDLMELLSLMDVRVGDTVELDLERESDGKAVTLKAVPNTLQKRQALRDAGSGRRRVEASAPRRMSRAESHQDLTAFANGLRERFAYLRLRGIDLDAELERITNDLADPVETRALADALDELLCRFGDGHASVRAPGSLGRDSGPFLPFLLGDSTDGLVGFAQSRDRYLDPERPIVVAMGGFPVEDCLAAVERHITAGSPQLVRRRALGLVRDVSIWYPALSDSPVPSELDIDVRAADSDETHQITVDLRSRKPTFGDWPRTKSETVGAFGYLRLPSMDDNAVAEVHQYMPTFADTDGLIVDVRGNGGGSRAALLALGGYLTPEGEPWVGNIAAYRLADGFDGDHLVARFMYREDATVWSEAQRKAVRQAEASFEPEWAPESEEFSAWHYLVLDRTGHENEYLYDRPVVILSDAACFSATDIFLGALELHPNVTLMGTASGGGSARSQSFKLPVSGIQVRCASMASFRPDGRLYDGRGIEVDVEVKPTPAYFLHEGQDAVLEAAFRHLENN